MDSVVMQEMGINNFNLSEYGRLKVVGSTGEVNTCFCCGKSNLKKTAVMQDSNGNYSFFGTTCAHNASNKWATSKNQNKNVSVPVEIVIAGRKYRVFGQAEVESFNTTTQAWQTSHVRGLFNLILDNVDNLRDVQNINKVVEIIEQWTSLRFPF